MDEESKPLTAFTVGPLGFMSAKECLSGSLMPSYLPETKGDLSRGLQSPLVYHLSGWHSHHLQGCDQSPWEAWGCILETGEKFKPSKCELFWWQLAYLGHIISAQGVATDEGKIEAIMNWPTPTNVMKIWSFLGFTGYYHRFIPKYVQVAQPLHKLAFGENVGEKAGC